MPHMPDHYQAEEDLRTMTRARDVATDAKRVAAARKVAMAQMSGLGAMITALRAAGKFKKHSKKPYA